MMHDATMQGSPRKKFNKIRELNRRRNYFTKKVRNALRVGVAKASAPPTPAAGGFVVRENCLTHAQ